MSNSVSNLSFRYHPEDEQLDDNYETSTSISTTSIPVTTKTEGTIEENIGSGGDSLNKVKGKLGIREESDKLFHRITKSVVEKFEEIKTERLKNQSKQRRSNLGQMENSSISDSEEPNSESSQVSSSEKTNKSAQEVLTNTVKSDKGDKKEETDASGSQDSSPDRSTTPVPTPTPDDGPTMDSEMDQSVKRDKSKSFKGMMKRKKGKTKSDTMTGFDKTGITFSALVDNDSDPETVEVGLEVHEAEIGDEGHASEMALAQQLDRLAHPSITRRLVRVVTNWHMLLLPLFAFFLHWCIQLPQYVVGFMVGSIGLLLLQKVMSTVREVLGPDAPVKQLKDLLPIKGLPIFRRSVYESDIAETCFESWMNEYNREYNPETYHITLTETVFVRLEGSRLRLSTPRVKIPKRALWNEPHYKMLFSRERLYDIADCQVELKPDGLIHRRSWSKKYPICIKLSATSHLGVRYKHKSQETVDQDAPWVEDEKYNFENNSEDSEDESLATIDSMSKKNNLLLDTLLDDRQSVDSIPSTDIIAANNGDFEEDADDFIKITPVAKQDSVLYLFARTDRDKETWFRRLTAAAGGLKTKEKCDSGGLPSCKSPPFDYLTFMLQLSQRSTAQLPIIKEHHSKSSVVGVNTADLSISTDMMWVNAFVGRVLFDVFQDHYKLVKIQEKIQKKLSTIKLPLFLEQLEVTHLELGEAVPIIQRSSRPVLNAQGIWVDLDIVYEGGFRMTVDTKLNMERIKQAGMQPESPNSESPRSGSPAKTPPPSNNPTPTPTLNLSEPGAVRKSAVYNSEVEDSAETSSEEPDTTRLQDMSMNQPGTGPFAQSKYIRILDKVAQSKYFQQVVDYKFIKKFVQNKNLQLVVELKGLLGTLVLNIPPPPSDRLWYGFRTNPKLWLSAHPKFGQQSVQIISSIIEKKLHLEFQRILVLPNMDDLMIPLMNHDIPS